MYSSNEKEIDIKKKTVYYFDVEETRKKKSKKSISKIIKTNSFKNVMLTLFFVNFGICSGLLISFLIKDYTTFKQDTWKQLIENIFSKEWYLMFLLVICLISLFITIAFIVINYKKSKKK